MYSNRDIRTAVLGAGVALLIVYFLWGSTPTKEKQETEGCGCR